MKQLTKDQIEHIIKWMNNWDQLEDKFIQEKFKEEFSATPKYTLIKHYSSPTQTIIVGTARTEEQWQEIFPELEKGQCQINTKWFGTAEEYKPNDNQEPLTPEEYNDILKLQQKLKIPGYMNRELSKFTIEDQGPLP